MPTRCAAYAEQQSRKGEDEGDGDGDGDDRLGGSYVWVDTVGWDDAELRDDLTFRDILRFIGEHPRVY